MSSRSSHPRQAISQRIGGRRQSHRVANFHEETVKSFLEMLSAAGISAPEELKRTHINRRIEMNQVLNYADIYPEVRVGGKLVKDRVN